MAKPDDKPAKKPSTLRKISAALVAAAALSGAIADAPKDVVGTAPPPQVAVPLLDYQKDYLRDQSRFKLWLAARGTRKTFTSTLEAVNDVFEVESHGGRTRWIIASRGERQSLVAIEFAKQHAKAFSLGITALTTEEQYQDEQTKEVITYKVHTITFPNGSEIIAVPANPDTLRGYTGNLLLDEFAFHADSRKIWAAVVPIIRGTYKLRVVSTPNGKGNKFYELATIESKVWKVHRVTIEDAVAQGLELNIAEQKEAINDDDIWAQEYMLEWLDEASAWISFDMINEVERDDAGKPDLYKGGACYSGEDIGIRSDLWVMWVAEMIGDVLVTREISVLPRAATFQAQDEERRRLFKKYLIVRHCMDQTGMGEKPVEDARREHGQLRVEGVLFNNTSKLLLATVGKERFQDKTIRIPIGDKALRADLHKLKKEATPNGAPRFVAPSDSEGHADRTWACFLACYAASGTPMVYEYIPVRMSASSYDDDDDPTEGGRWTTYRNGQEVF